jgi:two-component system, cell cycle response regulator DivK
MTTILYAEDQYEVRAMNSAYLQYHGFRVITAGDGDAALEVARTQRPDLIVLDHSMPFRTGLEVAQELQADPVTARIPIVMMTAITYGAVGRKAHEAGCVSFLAKPCLPSRLLEEVLRHTRTRTR